MVDYRAIIKTLQPEEIIKMMTELGADRYEDKPGWIVFPTICHNEVPEEASMKLYWYKDKKFFMCYTECGGMSIFQFLKEYYETRNILYNWKTDILDFVLSIGGQSFLKLKQKGAEPHVKRLVDRYKRKEENIKLPEYNEGVLNVFSNYYPPEWIDEGITTDAMRKFEISFYTPQKKIIIPHRSISGNLVGIRGRALDPWEVENIGKYMPVQVQGQWYSHPLSLNLYGLYQNKQNIKDYNVVYIFEGEKSVLTLESFQFPNVGVAVCGNNINRFQMNLLRPFKPNEIIICFDKEKDTERRGKRLSYFDKIYEMAEKYIDYYDVSFIHDVDNLLDWQDSPVDKGERVFKELLKKRVRVK